jgi:iron(III) transport system substrate-binding protein
MRKIFRALSAVIFASLPVMTIPALAQNVPALTNVSAEEKQRVTQLIEGAKKEGALSYWTVASQPEANNALIASFRKYYGLNDLKITATLSPHPPLVTRLEQEISAKSVTIDVASVGSPTWAYRAADQGFIQKYDSPEYEQYKKVIANKLSKAGYFAMTGGIFWVPAWNPEYLNFTGSSWAEIVNAVPAGRINAADAVRSEVIALNYMGLRKVLPLEYFEKIAAMRPVFTNRVEASTAALLTGEHYMALNAIVSRIYQANKKGAKLKFLMPSEGAVFFPTVTFIVAGAPHPNAAKLWTDFLHSQQGQQILVEHEALISGREGFKSPLPEYAPALADVTNVIPIDWSAVTPDEVNKARLEWSSVFKN